VEVQVKFDFTQRGAVELKIQSPSGTESRLLRPRNGDTATDGTQDWTYMSVQNWGENPIGSWKLIFSMNSNINAAGECDFVYKEIYLEMQIMHYKEILTALLLILVLCLKHISFAFTCVTNKRLYIYTCIRINTQENQILPVQVILAKMNSRTNIILCWNVLMSQRQYEGQ
jgi:hypothetical protein